MQKGIVLLSGGIDSAVAVHLMKNRLEMVAATFHQIPLSKGEEVEKTKKIAKVLKLKKLYLIPFINVLKTLTEKCNHKNYFILSKIAMFKTAELIAEKENATFLVTGENLGQVSSQTLSNLTTISKHLSLEVIRPLLTYDKQEIINIAKKISTYDISAGPELCSLLGPKHPATKSNPEEIGKELKNVGLTVLLKESLNNAKIIEA